MKSDMFTALAGVLLGIIIVAGIVGGVINLAGMGGLAIFIIALLVIYKFFH